MDIYLFEEDFDKLVEFVRKNNYKIFKKSIKSGICSKFEIQGKGIIGDVLVVKKEGKFRILIGTLGEVAILEKEATTNQAIAGLIPNNSKIETKYLYYIMKNKKSHIQSLGRGIAQKNINMSILRKIQIPLPTLAEQKKIIKVLEEKDYQISELIKKLDKVKEEQGEYLGKI